LIPAGTGFKGSAKWQMIEDFKAETRKEIDEEAGA
jgi:hypothetical protein